jgi:hypothetical protein
VIHRKGKESAGNLVITPLSTVTEQDLLETEAVVTLVFDEVPKGIARAIKKRQSVADILEINSSGVYLQIDKKFWRNALESCKEYHLKREAFEECAEIQALIERAFEYTQQPTAIDNPKKIGRYGEKGREWS